MWQTEKLQSSEKGQQLLEEYKEVVNKAKKQTDNMFYLYVQLIFAGILIVTSIMLRSSNPTVFTYVKDGYNRFFEKDTFIESTFSFNVFLDKMEEELKIRFRRLKEVFASSGRGSADIYPDNVSTSKYYLKDKGVIPAEGYISSPYGIRQNPFNTKQKEFHTGIDIAARKGTYIKAAFSGTVIAAGKSDIAGNYIRISSDNEIITLYAHNQFLFVKEGDTVVAGQVIATMGSTGLATGPHLHFEFIANGTRYNPIYALPL